MLTREQVEHRLNCLRGDLNASCDADIKAEIRLCDTCLALMDRVAELEAGQKKIDVKAVLEAVYEFGNWRLQQGAASGTSGEREAYCEAVANQWPAKIRRILEEFNNGV